MCVSHWEGAVLEYLCDARDIHPVAWKIPEALLSTVLQSGIPPVFQKGLSNTHPHPFSAASTLIPTYEKSKLTTGKREQNHHHGSHPGEDQGGHSGVVAALFPLLHGQLAFFQAPGQSHALVFQFPACELCCLLLHPAFLTSGRYSSLFPCGIKCSWLSSSKLASSFVSCCCCFWCWKLIFCFRYVHFFQWFSCSITSLYSYRKSQTNASPPHIHNQAIKGTKTV